MARRPIGNQENGGSMLTMFCPCARTEIFVGEEGEVWDMRGYAMPTLLIWEDRPSETVVACTKCRGICGEVPMSEEMVAYLGDEGSS